MSAITNEQALPDLLKEQARASLKLALDMLDAQPVRALGLLQYFARRYSDMLGEVMDEGEGEKDEEEYAGGLLRRPRRNATTAAGMLGEQVGPTLEAQRIAHLAQAQNMGDLQTRAWATQELVRLLPPTVAEAQQTHTHPDFEEA